MKKEWKVMPVILVTQVVSGIGWIVLGICDLYEGNTVADIMSAIALLALVVCGLFIFISVGHLEPSDEMSRHHLEKAQAAGYTVLGVCLMVAFSVSSIWKSVSVPFQVIAPILYGIGCLAVGLYFSRLETRGEPWQDW